MSSIVGAITGGGGSGVGYQAQKADILNPATTQQATDQYNNAQNALQQQQAFLQATQAQNGLGAQTQNLNQLNQIANGQGPNPAQSMLNQATGQNVAATQAAMAGQRGSGANVGLMSRQAAMQGANTQQQAAGQAATMQAQQSLGALGQAGQMANTMAGNQAAATSANTAATQGEQGQILNAIAAQNNANVGMQSNINSANAGMAQTIAGGQMNLLGNIAGGIGSGAMMGMMSKAAPAALALAAKGGKIQPMADGGSALPDLTVPAVDTAQSQGNKLADYFKDSGNIVGQNASQQANQGFNKLGSSIGQMLGNSVKSGITSTNNPSSLQSISTSGVNQYNGVQPAQNVEMAAAQGGKVPVLLSPGEIKLSPEQAKAVAQGKLNPMAAGQVVPGKPIVGGAKNDYANDIVPDQVEAGSVIVPRSETQSKNPVKNSINFVKATEAKKRHSKKAK